jgi:hypothetical protein
MREREALQVAYQRAAIARLVAATLVAEARQASEGSEALRAEARLHLAELRRLRGELRLLRAAREAEPCDE